MDDLHIEENLDEKGSDGEEKTAFRNESRSRRRRRVNGAWFLVVLIPLILCLLLALALLARYFLLGGAA